MSKEIIIYTDGACIRNPGPGGWGWYAPALDMRGSGGEKSTTNNRMELTAVIEALNSFKGGPLVIYSDSKYVVDCFTQKWWKGWIARGWKTSSKKPVKNQDLWKLFISQVTKPEGRVKFVWVKGHSGDAGNDEADRLATKMAEKFR